MNHECHMEKSGYACPICETEREKQEEDELINDLLEKWNWNYSIFDIYDELKEDYGVTKRFSRRFSLRHTPTLL